MAKRKRVLPEIGIGRQQQQFRSNYARQNRDDAEVPKLVGIKALLAAQLGNEQQTKNQAKGRHQTVGGKIETAKVK